MSEPTPDVGTISRDSRDGRFVIAIGSVPDGRSGAASGTNNAIARTGQFVALGALAAFFMFRGELPGELVGEEEEGRHYPQCALDGPHPTPVMATSDSEG